MRQNLCKERDDPLTDAVQRALGEYTQVDLTCLSPLFAPRPLLHGMREPAFSKAAAQLSLELSATAYSFDVEPWLDAGWTDISMQVDNKLLSGVGAVGEEKRWRQFVKNEWLPYRARARAQRTNPISQWRGAMRQKNAPCDTGKVITMMHRAQNGRYVVAIGFMGTGKRLYDWVSNLRMTQQDGLHTGFLQLTMQFEENAPQIEFPQTAAALGMDKLTLCDIVNECKKPDSRFLIWLSGHSQGGAVMQCWTYRRVQDGVLKDNILGYGFASPTVTGGSLKGNMTDYPLLHIINSDDIVPRVGALLHLGRCYVTAADENMRNACYRGMWRDENFRSMLSLTGCVRDSRDGLLFGIALFEAMIALPDDNSVAKAMFKRFLPDKMVDLVEDKLTNGLRLALRKLRQYQTALYGDAPCAREVARMKTRIMADMERMGATAYAKAVFEALALPHALARHDESGSIAPYTYAVTLGSDAPHTAMWCGPAAPMWDSRISRGTPKTQGKRAVLYRYRGLTNRRALRAAHTTRQ